jgi:hypothetical protein
MSDRGDEQRVLLLIKEDALVSDTKAKAGERRAKLFDVPGAATAVAIDAVKNLQRSLSIAGPQVSSGFR